ncbi:nuclear transport factor 2 family protein [Sphingobium nicotianae]|uniref:Nuclear transport factor 2 family protein n=1 Tax=Sphingobium nicotianae TaxID=2782607 RepID=A0A9X1IT11_9SPHN|nr:nuclear transport factor 2 family protein [Sphingobium nicotianae]MBT2189103.1 nuclear transport factor 2 family protein [Sphingobium nicotianae]
MTAIADTSSQDTEAIRCLLSDYGRLIDARDWEGWASLFTPDGAWVGGPYGEIQGREALIMFGKREFDGTPPCVHMLSNMAVRPDGARATAWSRWLLIEQRADGTLRPALAGSYADQLVRLAEGWRIQRREATLDLPAG